MFDVLMAWMADLLRLKVVPADSISRIPPKPWCRIADAESETRLLTRMAALDSLRRTLETNSFEPLAIEVGFLKASG